MIRFIKRILVLSVLIAGTIIFFCRFDNDLSSETNPNVFRVKNSVKFSGLDYLFVGGSYTYAGIIPGIFDSAGLKTYNLGTATAGPYFDEILINDYIKSCGTAPRNIVIDISPVSFTDKNDNWLSYPIHRYLNSPLSNEEITLKYKLFPLYAYLLQKSFLKGIGNSFHRLFYFIKGKGFRNRLDINNSTYKELLAGKGFEKDCTPFDPLIIKKEEMIFSPFRNSVFDTLKSECFSNMIDHYVQLGTGVVILKIPTNHLTNYFNSVFLDKFDAFYKKLGEKKGVHLVELNNPNNIFSEIYFRNTDHLNCKGAEKYTHFLLKQLMALQTTQK